jgi:hypothetical protein
MPGRPAGASRRGAEFGHAGHSSRDRRDAISSAGARMVEQVDDRDIVARCLVGRHHCEDVGDWKGAALAAQSTANRAHFLIGTCDANLHT